GLAEVRVGLGNRIALERILNEVQAQVACIRERPQWMVQEVVSIHPELQSVRLRELEVLEQGHIPVEVRRTVRYWNEGWAVLPNRGRSSKAIPIDELVGTSARIGIAGHKWVQLNRICAENRLVVDCDTVRGLGSDRTGDDRCALWACHCVGWI